MSSSAVAGCKIFNPDGRTLQHAGGILHENGLTDHYGAGQADIGQFDEDRDVDYVTGAAFAFKRALVDEIGLFDPRFFPAYFEELDFCIRAARAGYRIRYCHRAEAIHHESTSTGKFSQRFYYLYHRNRLKWILKHFTLRYFLGRFRRAEWKWIRHHSPKEQWLPLIRAYCGVSHRIIWALHQVDQGKGELMKRVLLLGLCPLPTENDTCTLAPGKRTWQFVKPLLEEGHRVCLVCSRHLAAYRNTDTEPVNAEEHGNLIYYSVHQEVFQNIDWLQRIHDNFDPDCIVGATVFPSYMAACLNTERPLWADLFGHIMAEAQTKSQVFRDNYYISQLWKQEVTILDRADILSVVSNPQSHATIGELGTRFRLNRATTGYQFVRVVPCSINDSPSGLNELSGTGSEGSVWFQGRIHHSLEWRVQHVDRCEHPVYALETIFREFPHVYFVSTGGEIASHDELTYRQFLNRIESSSFRDRYVMRGWIPFNEVPSCVRESNVGINIDLFSYEGMLGSRNRLLDWMQMKLPIITSELCELSQIIQKGIPWTDISTRRHKKGLLEHCTRR